MYTPVPIKRSTRYGNNYWEAYSPKIGRNVRLFSDLEYDHWVLVETDHRIQSFCEQPLKIGMSYEGKMVHSIFDMWILYKDGEQRFVEVKYSKELDPANQRSQRALQQTAVQRAWCQEHQYIHTARTELDIRSNSILLANRKYLLGYIKNRGTSIETDQFQILSHIKGEKTTIADIESSVQLHPTRIREAIFWLIYHGRVNADLDTQLICTLTEVWRSNDKKALD